MRAREPEVGAPSDLLHESHVSSDEAVPRCFVWFAAASAWDGTCSVSVWDVSTLRCQLPSGSGAQTCQGFSFALWVSQALVRSHRNEVVEGRAMPPF